ncbi:MAG TPA: TonB-dependent receptor [Gemmatimonadales bacterium]|nr:TonB-dependent receptor [Gemmatimonadales bacterium]
MRSSDPGIALPFLLCVPLLSAPLAAQVPDSGRVVPVEVEPIIVTTTRTAEPAGRLPAAITVREGATLGNAGPLDGLEGVLGSIPGVHVANRYNFSLDQRLSIRGFGSRANFGSRGVRVLLDGVPQTLPDGQTQFSNVEFVELSRVEVLRGAASALHGNASGGVIALQTARPGPAPFAQSAQFEGGAFGTFKWHARSSARRGPLGGFVSVSRLTTDGFREHSAADQRQLTALIELAPAPGTLASIRFSAADHPVADNPGALNAAELAADRTAAAPQNLARDAGKAVTQQQLSLQVRRRAADAEYGAVTYAIWRDLENPIATGTRIGLDRSVIGARLDASRRLGSGATAPRLTGGLDLQLMRDARTNADGSGALLVDQDDRVAEAGPFLQLHWSPLGPLLLEAGARYDRTTFRVTDHLLADGDDGGRRVLAAWSGRGGASLAVTPEVRTYVSVSTAFETPTTTELGNRPDGSGGLNPELAAQRGTSFEVGARGGSRRVSWSGAVFTSSIRDAITQFEEVGGRAYFRNAGRVRQRGVEAALDLRLHPLVTASLSYTLADYRFVEYVVDGASLAGNRLPGVPVHSGHAQIAFSPASWTFMLDHAASSRVWADDSNLLEAPGWGAGVTDLRVGWSGTAGQLDFEPFVVIRNLTDRRFVGSVTINGFNGRVFEPAPGRHVMLGLRGRFAVATP